MSNIYLANTIELNINVQLILEIITIARMRSSSRQFLQISGCHAVTWESVQTQETLLVQYTTGENNKKQWKALDLSCSPRILKYQMRQNDALWCSSKVCYYIYLKLSTNHDCKGHSFLSIDYFSFTLAVSIRGILLWFETPGHVRPMLGWTMVQLFQNTKRILFSVTLQ